MAETVGIPLVDLENLPSSSEKGGVPSFVKIAHIYLYSTADQATGITYEDAPENDPNAYDITSVVTELEITESINSIAVVGSMTIVDNFNFFQDARIHGQEKIYISFKRYNTETNDYDTTINREFLVTGLSAFERSEFRLGFTLEFASPHAFVEKTKRIGRAYGYTDMVAATSDISGAAEAIQAWREKYTDENPDNKIVYENIFEILEDPNDPGGLWAEEPNTLEYPEQMIYHILRNDLGLPATRVWLYGYHPAQNRDLRGSQNKMKVVIPNWRPFQAIKWLLRNTFSTKSGADGKPMGHPWFCYDTLLAGVRIEPYKMFIADSNGTGGYESSDLELYTTGRTAKSMSGTYFYNPQFTADPESKQYFQDMHRKILEIRFGVAFDQFTKAGNGTYSTRQWFADVPTKYVMPNLYKLIDETSIKYTDEIFQAGEDYLPGHAKGYAERVDSNAVDFKDTNYTYFIPYNSALHGTTEETYPYNKPFDYAEEGSEDPKLLGRIPRTADMIRRNMDFMQHTIKVLGDFRLNPGMVIDIELQKAIDPQLLEKTKGKRDPASNQDIKDEYLSGKYFVSECTHVFAEQTFHTYATINRDSSSLNLD